MLSRESTAAMSGCELIMLYEMNDMYVIAVSLAMPKKNKRFCLHSTTNNKARFEPNKLILGGPGENQPEPHTFTYTILQSLLTGKTHSKLLLQNTSIVHSPYPY